MEKYFKKIAIVSAWVLGSLIVVFIVFLIGFSIWLTPQRISGIVSKLASENLDAEVKIEGLNYTLFRHYPQLSVTWDSVIVISKAFNHLPIEEKKDLPEDADYLSSLGPGKIKLNFKDLIKKKINIKEIDIEHPEINLVILNDSLANFNIFPKIKKLPEIKDFEMGDINIASPVIVKIIDVPKNMNLSSLTDCLLFARVKDKALIPDIENEIEKEKRDKKKKNKTYELKFSTIIEGKIDSIALPHSLPIGLEGFVSFSKKFNILSLSNFIIKLASLNSIINTEINIPERIIEFLKLKLETGNLSELEGYCPENYLNKIEYIENVEGSAWITLNLEIDSPFSLRETIENGFDLKDIPPFSLSAEITGADLKYNANGFNTIEVDTIDCLSRFRFNAHHITESFLEIPKLILTGKGINVSLSGNVFNPLTNDSEFKINATFDTELSKSLAPLISSIGINPQGSIQGHIKMNGDFAFSNTIMLKNIVAEGNFSSKNLHLSSNKAPLDILLKDFNIKLDGKFPTLGASIPSVGNLAIDFNAGSLCASDKKDMKAEINKLDLDADISASSPILYSSPVTLGTLGLRIGDMTFSTTSSSLKLQGLNYGMKGRLLTTPPSITNNYSPVPLSQNESLIESRSPHTSLYLIPSGNGIFQTLISMLESQMQLQIKEGQFLTDVFLADNSFSNLNIATDMDRVDIHSLDIRSDDSSLELSGSISGLKNFLTSSSPSLFSVDLNADFDNVNIDRLSGAYYGAIEKKTGKKYDFTISPQTQFTAADSLCVLIPRNIKGDVRLRAKQAQYMGYKFSPLSTDILINSGSATLSKLTIGAPYCNLSVDWTYSTASLDNIYMDLSAEVGNFTFTEFFKTFPKLVSSVSHLSDLSGEISSTMEGRFNLYPSMFMNPASMKADFKIMGNHLQFARESKIVDRITHLMMIEGEGPIKMKELDISGSFHDNLLMLNPFKLEFDNYVIGLAGVNNLQGEMYYHLALEKSPFHMPFAVNLVGKYPHPEVRFGGTEIKDGREKLISSELGNTVNINIMTWLKRGWKMFIQAAAKYDLQKEK